MIKITEKVTRLAVLASHFIQYNSPIYREISNNPSIDLTVYYLSDHGRRPSFDKDFGSAFAWDVPLDEGYHWELLPRAAGRSITDRKLNEVFDILDILAKRSFDVIFLQLDYSRISVLIFLYACLILHIPVLYRGDTTLIHERQRRKKLKRFLLKPIFQKIVWGLYVGKLAKEYITDLGVPDTRLTASPHSVDSDFWTSEANELLPRKEELRRVFDLPTRKTAILYCGKAINVKRPLDLIVAAGELSHNEPISLLIVGSGALLDRMKEEAMRFPQLDIAFTGFINQSQIASAYAASDIVVLPSSSETWGLVVNEAMYFGCIPIVSNMVGCGPDLVEGIGEIYPVGNIGALKKAIVSIISDMPQRRARIPARIANYSLRQTVDGIVKASLDASYSRYHRSF